MPAIDTVLGRLLEPVPPATFLDAYWEKTSCLVKRASASYYDRLLGVADLDALISLSGSSPSTDDLRIVKTVDGKFASEAAPRNPNGSPNMFALYHAYHEGHTLVVNGVDGRWTPVAALCRQLEAALHHRVGANLYFTPAQSQGFSAHADSHDVFILQLEGSKRWRLYEQVVAPLPGASGSVAADRLGPPRQEFVLDSGDLLYIPRGLVHDAVSTEHSSLHLTVGVYATTWADLMKAAVSAAAEDDPRMREALPAGFLNANPGDLQGQFAQALAMVQASNHLEKALQRLADRFFSSAHPVPTGHFSSLDRVRDLTESTTVQRREGVLCAAFTSSEAAGIRFQGNSVSGPAFLAPAFAFVAQHETFTVSDLPGRINSQSKRVLVGRLVRDGLLSITP